MDELVKYKHYLIFIMALLVALYITDPLWVKYNELKQTSSMHQKRASKLTDLLAQQKTLQEQLSIATDNAQQLLPYVFTKSSESEFKLSAQQLIEKTFNQSGCDIDRLGWQGKTPLNDKIMQWRLNIRFSGNALCVVKTTKQLELLSPLIRFTDYSYTSRDWQGGSEQSLTGDIDLIMWNNIQPNKEHEVSQI